MGECANDRRIGIGAELGPDQERIARREEIIGRDGIMQNRKALGINSLVHKVPLHSMGNRQQMPLLAMPQRPSKTLHVSDRWRTTEPFEPAAPPASRGEC